MRISLSSVHAIVLVWCCVFCPSGCFVDLDGVQVVGRQARRPTSGDLEVAFYNAAAVNSPLTQGVRFIKGLGGRGK
jgi:hypothetical protein